MENGIYRANEIRMTAIKRSILKGESLEVYSNSCFYFAVFQLCLFLSFCPTYQESKNRFLLTAET